MGTGIDLWNQWATLYNQQDVAGLASLVTDDAIYVVPHLRWEGREAIQAWWDAWSKAFSHISMETSLVIEDGDVVVAEWTLQDTHTQPLVVPGGGTIAPTGKTETRAGVTVSRVRAAKFETMRSYYHTLSAMSQAPG